MGDCSAFLQEFRNWESAWAMEVVYVIAYEIRVLAERVGFANSYIGGFLGFSLYGI